MGSWLLLANRPIQNKSPGFSYQYSQSTCLCRSKTLPNQHTSMNKNYLCMIYAVTKRHAQKTSYNLNLQWQGSLGKKNNLRRLLACIFFLMSHVLTLLTSDKALLPSEGLSSATNHVSLTLGCSTQFISSMTTWCNGEKAQQF